jgi:hypothetical protein
MGEPEGYGAILAPGGGCVDAASRGSLGGDEVRGPALSFPWWRDLNTVLGA